MEARLRFGVFVAMLLMVRWEALRPTRRLGLQRRRR